MITTITTTIMAKANYELYRFMVKNHSLLFRVMGTPIPFPTLDEIEPLLRERQNLIKNSSILKALNICFNSLQEDNMRFATRIFGLIYSGKETLKRC